MADKQDDDKTAAENKAKAQAETQATGTASPEKASTPADAVKKDETEASPETETTPAPDADTPAAEDETPDEKSPDDKAPDDKAPGPWGQEGAAEDLTAPEHDPRDEAPKAAQDTPSPAASSGSSADTPAETVVVRRGGFFPALLGGVVAAAVGFGVAVVVFPDGAPFLKPDGQDTASLLKQQQNQIKTIGDKLNSVDVQSLNAMQGKLGDLSKTVEANASALKDLTSRVSALENAPTDTGVPQAQIDNYDSKLSAMQQSLEQQRTEIQQMMDQAKKLKSDAAATEREAQIRTTVAALNKALDDGGAFGKELDTLGQLGVDVPNDLSAHATSGVSTLAQLQSSFPDAARDALAATREGAGLGGSVTGFLKDQLGVRSLKPQKGDSPDAILSRAEAALKQGKLKESLADLDGLPEKAQTQMQDWRARANARENAIAAADKISADNLN